MGCRYSFEKPLDFIAEGSLCASASLREYSGFQALGENHWHLQVSNPIRRWR